MTLGTFQWWHSLWVGNFPPGDQNLHSLDLVVSPSPGTWQSSASSQWKGKGKAKKPHHLLKPQPRASHIIAEARASYVAILEHKRS